MVDRDHAAELCLPSASRAAKANLSSIFVEKISLVWRERIDYGFDSG